MAPGVEERRLWGGALRALAVLALLLTGACRGGVGEEVPPPPTPAPVPSTGRFVQGPAGRLFVDDGGSGTGLPLLFIHGLGGDHTLWSSQLEAFRRGRRAVALDLRGFGKSDPDPAGDYTIPAFAADVAAAAEGLGIPRYVLVGHSMGGPVAAACAAAHPDRVAGVVFDDPAGDLTQIPAKEAEAWLARFGPETYEAYREEWYGEMLERARPEVREKVLAVLRATPREVVAPSARGLVSYDPKPALAAYAGPMLSINTPENDAPYSLHRLRPSIRVQVVEGASHWVMMDRPDAFDAALADFLKGLEAGGP